MKTLSEWWVKWRLTRKTHKRLKEITARLDELELLLWQRRWGKQSNRTAEGKQRAQAMTWDHPWDRQDRDFLKDSEKVEMDALAEEHFTLTQFLSKNGQGSQEYFRPKMNGGVLLGEDSPKAYMTVTQDRSRNHTWEYDEELGVEWHYINGKRTSNKYSWRNVPKRAYYPEGFPEAANAYGRAKEAGDEELMASILQEYKDKGYAVR